MQTSEYFQKHLQQVVLEWLGESFRIEDCSVHMDTGGHLILTLRPGFFIAASHLEPLKQQYLRFLRQQAPDFPVNTLSLRLEPCITAHGETAGKRPIVGVKNVIAISSGKGGVGKSTTAVNLAAALSLLGARVGLLDADIYGPNQPLMLGVVPGRDKVAVEQKRFHPLIRWGLQTMSIGYLMDPEVPAAWRGPMISKALEQLLFDTLWQELDYLLIDMPPGTGDISLTLASKVPLAGALVVTTPQAVAVLDASKGLRLFKQLEVPVLGVIENMSHFECPACGHAADLFGQGGGEALALEYQVPLLGCIPLARGIREQADEGHPFVLAHPETVVTQRYLDLAAKLSMLVAKQPQSRVVIPPSPVH